MKTRSLFLILKLDSDRVKFCAVQNAPFNVLHDPRTYQQKASKKGKAKAGVLNYQSTYTQYVLYRETSTLKVPVFSKSHPAFAPKENCIAPQFWSEVPQ